MKTIPKWSLLGIGGLILAGYGGLSWMAGGPKDTIQMVRYALPYMHRGHLKVGDRVPDVPLVSLDGTTRFGLRQHLAGRPLVLVFGSFT